MDNIDLSFKKFSDRALRRFSTGELMLLNDTIQAFTKLKSFATNLLNNLTMTTNCYELMHLCSDLVASCSGLILRHYDDPIDQESVKLYEFLFCSDWHTKDVISGPPLGFENEYSRQLPQLSDITNPEGDGTYLETEVRKEAFKVKGPYNCEDVAGTDPHLRNERSILGEVAGYRPIYFEYENIGYGETLYLRNIRSNSTGSMFLKFLHKYLFCPTLGSTYYSVAKFENGSSIYSLPFVISPAVSIHPFQVISFLANAGAYIITEETAEGSQVVRSLTDKFSVTDRIGNGSVAIYADEGFTGPQYSGDRYTVSRHPHCVKNFDDSSNYLGTMNYIVDSGRVINYPYFRQDHFTSDQGLITFEQVFYPITSFGYDSVLSELNAMYNWMLAYNKTIDYFISNRDLNTEKLHQAYAAATRSLWLSMARGKSLDRYLSYLSDTYSESGDCDTGSEDSEFR